MNINSNLYRIKYLKYKAKYTELKAQIGGTNRFTLIIRPYWNIYHHSYKYYIIDNKKPTNIDVFDSSIIFYFSDPTKTHENIVAYYNDQTSLITEGDYDGLQWPTVKNPPVFIDTPPHENLIYREENSKKFGDQILEFIRKKEKNELPDLIFDSEGKTDGLMRIHFGELIS